MRARARTKMGTTLGALMLLGGALVTSAGAGIGDSRSPDAIDAGIQAHAVVAAEQRSPDAPAAVLVAGAGDRRSPDAMDAATRAHALVVVDLRSPDARPAARAAPTSCGNLSGSACQRRRLQLERRRDWRHQRYCTHANSRRRVPSGPAQWKEARHLAARERGTGRGLCASRKVEKARPWRAFYSAATSSPTSRSLTCRSSARDPRRRPSSSDIPAPPTLTEELRSMYPPVKQFETRRAELRLLYVARSGERARTLSGTVFRRLMKRWRGLSLLAFRR